MSVVWAGTHLRTGKEVALKLLKSEAAKDEATRRRMLREARAACAVKHPNVVEIHDVLELEDGSPVLVMDLLRGESLRDRLLRRAPLSVQETATLLLPVVSAAATAHAAGIVHRDLKPENIFLAHEGGRTNVKVLDFGIAKVTASSNVVSQVNALTNTGTMLGTPYYMAPEQILGEAIDHRADVWSLGVILYECLVGVRPTEAENIGKILKRVLTNEIEPLSSKAPDLPAEVTGLVDRMLMQAASDRPASMREVGEVLAPFAEGVTLGDLAPPATSAPSSDAATERPRRDRVSAAGRVHTEEPGPERPVDPHAQTDAAPARTARARELVETLVAPGQASPRAAMASAPRSQPSPPQAHEEGHSAARGGEIARERVSGAPSFPGRWAVPLVGLALVGVGASGAYFVLAKGKERTPYVPASASVALSGSGECPAGMALVPGGSFRMGSDEGKDDEQPIHEVSVRPFCMDVSEVTVQEYRKCNQRGACRAPESTVKWAGIADAIKEKDSNACTAYQDDQVNLPINCISWTDSEAYCQAEGKRLPTEAEWEYAAGGGTEHRQYPWGPAPPSPTLLNACDASCIAGMPPPDNKKQAMFEESDGFAVLAPGGKFPAGDTKFGVHDMAGNVWEWTASPYCNYPDHTCTSQHRVFRGGGWGGVLASNLRVSARLWSNPAHRYNDVGFRCVKDR